MEQRGRREPEGPHALAHVADATAGLEVPCGSGGPGMEVGDRTEDDIGEDAPDQRDRDRCRPSRSGVERERLRRVRCHGSIVPFARCPSLYAASHGCPVEHV